VAPLTLNKDLCAHAQKWADHLAKIGAFQHSDCNYNGTRVGENIAMKGGSGNFTYTGRLASTRLNHARGL
jgi:uncharacterized protein YkwD